MNEEEFKRKTVNRLPKTGQAPNNYIVIPISLKLTREENKVFMEMRKSQGLSAPALVKQALRVLQMYRAGYLIDNSPKSGGCGASE